MWASNRSQLAQQNTKLYNTMADSPQSNTTKQQFHIRIAESMTFLSSALCCAYHSSRFYNNHEQHQPTFNKALIAHKNGPQQGLFAFDLVQHKKSHGLYLCLHLRLHCLHFLLGFQPFSSPFRAFNPLHHIWMGLQVWRVMNKLYRQPEKNKSLKGSNNNNNNAQSSNPNFSLFP